MIQPLRPRLVPPTTRPGARLPDLPAYATGKRVSTAVTAAPSPAELAILRAVSYAAVFDFPLTAEEVRRTLPRLSMSLDDVRRLLDESPFLKSRVHRVDDWYLPAGRPDLVERRQTRSVHSRAFLTAHRRTLDILCAVPFTRLIAISGSLAHLNSDRNADLDMFVITRGPRVWTVALMMVVLAKLLRRRDVVCVNFLIADSRLALDQRDLYTASQVLHLRPVSGHDAYAAFLDANPFVREWFPNADAQPPAPFPLPQPGALRALKRMLELLLWVPSRLIEALCRRAYGWHLRRAVSRWRSPDQVRLEPCCLKLHTNSHRVAVLDRFERVVTHLTRATAADRPPADVY